MRRIQHIFNYIFYMAYKKEEKRWASTPLISGILRISLLVNLFILIITLLVEIIFKIEIIFGKYEQNLLIPAIIIEIVVASINYYIYGYKKKYLKIVEKYNNENKEMRKKNRRAAVFFIIFSLILAVITEIIKIQLH